MSEPELNPPVVAAAEPAAPPPPSGSVLPAWLPWLLALLGIAVLLCVVLAWQSLSRQQSLEQELVRRQEASQAQATEARLAAKQSGELVRDTAAKVSLLEARLAEVALQRGQLEDLIQSMSRSRDENVVGDIEAALRAACMSLSRACSNASASARSRSRSTNRASVSATTCSRSANMTSS